MARMKENPRYYVVSMRISEVERRRLEDLMEKTHKNASQIMREATEYFSEVHNQTVPDRTNE